MQLKLTLCLPLLFQGAPTLRQEAPQDDLCESPKVIIDLGYWLLLLPHSSYSIGEIHVCTIMAIKQIYLCSHRLKDVASKRILLKRIKEDKHKKRNSKKEKKLFFRDVMDHLNMRLSLIIRQRRQGTGGISLKV